MTTITEPLPPGPWTAGEPYYIEEGEERYPDVRVPIYDEYGRIVVRLCVPDGWSQWDEQAQRPALTTEMRAIVRLILAASEAHEC